MELTKCELEVMNVLWRAKRPLSRNDIIALSVEKSWKDSSIHILLNGLLRKGAIKEDGSVRCGRTYARLFSPLVSREAYYTQAALSSGGGKDLPLLFSALLHSEGVTPQLLDELEGILEKRKAELDGE
ncbi:MAG: BlaI/MecI/CopY family transcriptional regulator [Oscillospiraceae bacterium]